MQSCDLNINAFGSKKEYALVLNGNKDSIWNRDYPHPTSILILCWTVGIALLNQPYVFLQSGIAGGILLWIVITVLSIIGNILLSSVSAEKNNYCLKDLLKCAFNESIGECMFEFMSGIISLGSLLASMITIGVFLSDVLIIVNCGDEICNNPSALLFISFIIISAVFFFRWDRYLAYSSLFTFVSTISMASLIILAGPFTFAGHLGDIALIDNFGAIASLGSIIFIQSYPITAFQAYLASSKYLGNVDYRDGLYDRTTFQASIVAATLSAVAGLVGYISFRDVTYSNILNSFPENGYWVFKFYMLIQFLMLAPFDFNILRNSLLRIVFGIHRQYKLPWKFDLVFTVVLLLSLVAVAVALISYSPSLSFGLILSITGALGGSLSKFVFPAVIYLRLSSHKTGYYRVMAMVLLAAGIALAFTAFVACLLAYTDASYSDLDARTSREYLLG